MKKITIIKVGEISANVAFLHQVLTALNMGFRIDPAEISQQQAGPATIAAVRMLQRRFQLAVNEDLLVDRATADLLNNMSAAAGIVSDDYFVAGQVLRNGLPLPDVTVSAFDQDLPAKKIPRQLLGKPAITDKNGNFHISYSPEEFKLAEHRTADLVLVVSGRAQDLLHETKVYYNAEPQKTILISFEKEEGRKLVEFDNYVRIISPVLNNELVIENLSDKDIEFLTNETSIPAAHLLLLRLAFNWESNFFKGGVPAQFLYAALRQQFSENLSLWAQRSYEDIQRAVQLSTEQAIVKTFNEDQFKKFIPHILATASRQLQLQSSQPGEASIGSILSTVISDEQKQLTFIQRYNAQKNDVAGFWNSLSGDPLFREQVPALRIAVYLGSVTNNNLSLIKAVQESGKVKSPEQLVEFETEDWKNLISKSNSTIPEFISGEGEERIANYAASILATLEQEFPTQFVVKSLQKKIAPDFKLIRDNLNEEINLTNIIDLDVSTVKFKGDSNTQQRSRKQLEYLQKEILAFPEFGNILSNKDPFKNGGEGVIENPIRQEVSNFMTAASQFDISKVPVDKYLETAEGKAVVERLGNKEATVSQVKRMQRVYNVSGDASSMNKLLESGIHSAYQIASMPPGQYLQAMSGKMSTQQILAIQAKAASITEQSASSYQFMHANTMQMMPAVIGGLLGGDAVVKDIPNYEKLFGSLDMCECSHCRSVYSATAYFVSLVHDLLGGKYQGKQPSLAKPAKELFKRRPDLKFLKLSCQNTETEIPYIDLINEILETYIAFGKLDEAHTRDTSSFTAQELAANPQFVIDKAYEELGEAVYPLTLPFNLNLDTVRKFLEYLGSSRYEIMNAFRKDENHPFIQSIAAERLQISEKEYELLTGKNFNGQTVNYQEWKLFGFSNGALPLFHSSRLRHVKSFMERTNIKLKELLDILKTNFINPYWRVENFLADPKTEEDPVLKIEKQEFEIKPQNAPVLKAVKEATIVLSNATNASCDLSTTDILYKNGSPVSDKDYAQINRFIRLWKKLGITIQELDLLLLSVTDKKNPSVSTDTLQKLSGAIAVKKQLNIPVNRLVTLWGSIDTLSEYCLYDSLFLNKSALKIDDKLKLNITRDDLKGPNIKIDDHIPAILSAFRVGEKDIQDIRKHASLNNENQLITIESLSAIFRYTVLAKALKISIQDLISLLTLAPSINPFASPAETERFVGLTSNVKKSGFKLNQLVYLYLHQTPASLEMESSIKDIVALAKTIREGLEKIETENSLTENPGITFISEKLGKIFDRIIVEQVTGTLDDTFVYSASLSSLPADIPLSLRSKCEYDSVEQKLNVKGLLHPSQKNELISIAPANGDFVSAINQLYNQPGEFFTTILYGFLDATNVQELLYEAPTAESSEVLSTIEQRSLYFSKKLLPFLKSRLSSLFLIQFIAEKCKIEVDSATLLFKEALPGLETDLLALKNGGLDGRYFNNIDLTDLKFNRIDEKLDFDWSSNSPDPALITNDTFSVRWSGKLFAPSSEEYSFYTETDDGVRLWIDNQLIIDKWVDQPLTEHRGKIKLKAGQPYDVRMEYYQNILSAIARLKWSSATTPKSIIPSGYLFADSLIHRFNEQYLLCTKISQLINGFGLKESELNHFITNAAEFDDFNLTGIPVIANTLYNEKPFTQWQRIFQYTQLRNSVPKIENYSLLSIFEAANGSFTDLLNTLKNATGWSALALDSLLGSDFGQGFFAANASSYKNEKFLTKLSKCIEIGNQLGISVQKLTNWATSAVGSDQARDVKNTVRARYEEPDWLLVAKEINNNLRELQRDALVEFLLASSSAQSLGLKDRNDLYQYFLIDVEMDSCMATSRIVQANSSVQLFVQRCLLNLEPNVSPSLIDETHWNWMKKYRVWEANRKVFLYPENWIEPELRDNKSPFFKELENELLQGELTDENVESALMSYLMKLDTVARLDIRGVYDDDEENTLHVFGRSFNVPYQYFYRKYNKETKVWTPWEKIQADIEGNHLLPVMWNRRLYLFWAIFTEKAKPQSASQKLSGSEPTKYFEIKIAWSELRKQQWTPKKMSVGCLESQIITGFAGWEPTEVITFRSLVGLQNQLIIRCYSLTLARYQWSIGQFIFDGCNSSPKVSTSTNNHPPMVHLTGTYVRNMAFEETTNVTIDNSNNQLIVFKGNFPNSALAEPEFDKSKYDIAVLNSTPGNFQVVASAQGPQFSMNRPFFFQDRHRVYFVDPRTAIDLGNIAMGPKTVIPKIPDYEMFTPYLPWKDDPKPGETVIKWTDPVSYNLNSAPVLDFNTSLNVNSEFAGTDLIVTNRSNTALSGNFTFSEEISANLIGVASQYNYATAAVVEKYKWKIFKQKYTFRFSTFFHPFVCPFMKTIGKDNISGLLTIKNQKRGELNSQYQLINDAATTFKSLYAPLANVPFPYPHEIVDFSESGAYSAYNWELFFHVPMLIANRLKTNQQFEKAMHWYHFVFNPTSVLNESAPKRYWNVLPFKTTPKESIQQLLEKLQLSNGNPVKESLEDQINQWKDNPFNPHLIARKRLIAYMKNVVMKYLDNLIAWGDHLFQQDSMESVNEATQIYVLAAEILGKRGEKIPSRSHTIAQTYESLRYKLDEFDNAMVTMETMFPFYSTKPVVNGVNSKAGQLTNLVQSLYFCIPDNDKLLRYWDIVEDRLFKIRHCQNLDGVERKLSLFEPPIDPALLVQAAANGISISSVLSDSNAPMPHYRFNYIIARAHDYCNELKNLASALLSAIEKKDGEELAMIRATQETAILSLNRDIKKMQYNEAVISRDNILKTRNSAVQRWKHYKILLGEEDPKEPAIGVNISAVSLPADQSSVKSGRRISSYEGQDLSKSKKAADSQATAADWELWSNIAHIVPNFNIEPWGVGTTFGGSNVGSALGAVAKQHQNDAAESNVLAANASKLGGYFRREQDWVLQCNLAAGDIMAIDKQIAASEIRIDIAAKERENHEANIENAKRIEEFLRSKYSKEELYGWMQGEITTVFFQAYQMAYDLAKKAEKCYRFELGITQSNFIQFGYWDSFRRGLMVGEKLSLALKQLEKAYTDQNKREYEITRHISLQQFTPAELIQLKERGSCEIYLPESLFDMDYPGHFMRRIKTVSISIPCIVGPYTSINCKLTLLSSETRIDASGDYEKREDDTRFINNFSALQSIATSHAQNDSGLFELNFRDERYLPFEGYGAVSRWRLEMPRQNNAFDFNSISDVVIHLKYTSRDGGSGFRTKVNNFMATNVPKEGQRMFSILHDFPNEWHQFISQPGIGNLIPFQVELTNNHFSYQFADKLNNMSFTNILLIVIPQTEIDLNPKHPVFGNVAVSTTVKIQNNIITLDDQTISSLNSILKKNGGQRLDALKIKNVLILFSYTL